MAGCTHSHKATNRAFIISIVANGLFVIFQLIFARLSHSTSLLADAVHNLGDVFSLVVAWVGNYLLTKNATAKTTYGLKKASILAAFFNVVLLVFTCGFIAAEALAKFFNPAEINSMFVVIAAGAGVVVNAATALLFIKDNGDLNIRAAYLHLASDAVVSLGVVLTAVAYWWTNWAWLDPLVGLLIAVLILKGSWSVLIDSGRLLIDGVPSHISYSEVKEMLLNQPGVVDLHYLHIWAMSTKENALSVHLFMPDGVLTDKDRYSLSKKLLDDYGIHHVTIQVELATNYCDYACKC